MKLNIENWNYKGRSSDSISSMNKRELTKLEFLNQKYSKNATLNNYWRYFEHIKPMEDKYNKDLSHFSKSEIKELLMQITGSYLSGCWSLIKKYIDWCLEEGYTSEVNHIKSLNMKDYISLYPDYYITLEEVYELCNKAVKYQENLLVGCIIIILARLGIYGVDLVDLKGLRWSDINFDTNIIYVKNHINDELLYEIRIDNITKKWLLNAKKKYTGYLDSNTVIKLSNQSKSNHMHLHQVTKRVFKVVKRNNITLGQLKRCMEIDELTKISLKKGGLAIEDYKYITEKYNKGCSDTTYFKLKEEYKSLFPYVCDLETNQHQNYKNEITLKKTIQNKVIKLLTLLSDKDHNIYIEEPSNEYDLLNKYATILDKTISELLSQHKLNRIYNSVNTKMKPNISDDLDITQEEDDEFIKNILNQLHILNGKTEKSTKNSRSTTRNIKLSKLLKRMYYNKCQLCEEHNHLPIIEKSDGTQYVEVHHIINLSSIYREEYECDNIDYYYNAIVVCSHHHKYLHFHNGGFCKLIKKNGSLYLKSNKGTLIKIAFDKHLFKNPKIVEE